MDPLCSQNVAVDDDNKAAAMHSAPLRAFYVRRDQGEPSYQEDTFDVGRSSLPAGYVYMALYDGHGGEQTSSIAAYGNADLTLPSRTVRPTSAVCASSSSSSSSEGGPSTSEIPQHTVGLPRFTDWMDEYTRRHGGLPKSEEEAAQLFGAYDLALGRYVAHAGDLRDKIVYRRDTLRDMAWGSSAPHPLLDMHDVDSQPDNDDNNDNDQEGNRPQPPPKKTRSQKQQRSQKNRFKVQRRRYDGSGSTACVAALSTADRCLYVYTCGDSRAMVFSTEHESTSRSGEAGNKSLSSTSSPCSTMVVATDLCTNDHKPVPGTAEAERATTYGGFVSQEDGPGCPRVGAECASTMYSVSRGFGDYPLKSTFSRSGECRVDQCADGKQWNSRALRHYTPHGVMSCHPDVYRVPFVPGRRYVVLLGSDGLWDHVDDAVEEAILAGLQGVAAAQEEKRAPRRRRRPHAAPRSAARRAPSKRLSSCRDGGVPAVHLRSASAAGVVEEDDNDDSSVSGDGGEDSRDDDDDDDDEVATDATVTRGSTERTPKNHPLSTPHQWVERALRRHPHDPDRCVKDIASQALRFAKPRELHDNLTVMVMMYDVCAPSPSTTMQ